MKNCIVLLLLCVVTLNCATQKQPPVPKEREDQVTLKPEKNDDGEWDIEVLDPQWSYFLNAIAQPIAMYSLPTLESRNRMLVSEWNSYYYSGRYRNVIESSIHYDSQENYGLNFNYKLYQVFCFVQWKYGLKLSGLSMTEVR